MMRLQNVSKACATLTVASALLIVPLVTEQSAHATITKLSLPATIQLKSNWCWAASDYSILAHYGYYGANQIDIVNYTFGTTDAPNYGANLAQAQNALHHFGVSTNSFAGALSYSALQAQINGNKPVFTDWKFTVGTEHAVVAYGYDTDAATVYYMDPWDGLKYYRPYEKYVKSDDRSWIGGLKTPGPINKTTEEA